MLDGVDAVRRGDGADDGAQRTTGVGLGKAGVFVALALEEVRERVCAAWMNQQDRAADTLQFEVRAGLAVRAADCKKILPLEEAA